MDKSMFDLIDKYNSLENNLYFKLIEEKGMSEDEAEELIDGFSDLYCKTLKLGKYLDQQLYINKDTYLVKGYESLSSYTKLNVIYQYENGMTLCETTSGLIILVPQDYLANYK